MKKKSTLARKVFGAVRLNKGQLFSKHTLVTLGLLYFKHISTYIEEAKIDE